MITNKLFGPISSPLENITIGNFVSELIWQKPNGVRDYCSMAVYDGGELIAGVLFHEWHREHGVIELTSAAISKRWLSRSVINTMFDFPFGKLGCQLVALRVSERNTNMLRIARSFGFSEVFIPRLRGRNEGEFIFTFTDDQWSSSKFRKAD